jgi:LPS-assembly protein
VLYNQPGIPAAYFIARHEVSASAASNFGPFAISAGATRNLANGTFDSASFSAGWQNECMAVSLNFYKRFTSFNLDDGSTTVLLQITFKTLGNVGFSAL